MAGQFADSSNEAGDNEGLRRRAHDPASSLVQKANAPQLDLSLAEEHEDAPSALSSGRRIGSDPGSPPSVLEGHSPSAPSKQSAAGRLQKIVRSRSILGGFVRSVTAILEGSDSPLSLRPFRANSFGTLTSPNGESAGGSAQAQPHMQRRASTLMTQEMKEKRSLDLCETHQEECRNLLQRLRDGVPGSVTEEELELEYQDLLRYKNRWMKARLLHYAVYDCSLREHEADAGAVVKLVLDAKASLHGKASYKKEDQENKLEAIHIAAGLGSVQAMRSLVEAKTPEQTYEIVNTYCLIDGNHFYTPIHEAAYLGKKDAVSWLLENRANPDMQNKDGYTPLHWLAKKGLEPEQDLEVMVRLLLKHKARLDVRAVDGQHERNGEGQIPLEFAAEDSSHFPRRLLHLLAPSFQGPDQKEDRHSFFSDMCVLSSLNEDAARQLARQLSESTDPACHQRVRKDAQKENAVDRMANLFHMSPEAAADLLEILMVKPIVQDGGKHNIPTRAKMSGLLYRHPMRCAYQADSDKKDGLIMPEWRYDSEKADDRTLKDQPEIQWHLSLAPSPEQSEERREFVDDVDTKVCLLPNIIDIDVFMALACTRNQHRRIFAKLPVQGVIYCAWEQLMVPAFWTRFLLNCVDLLVQSWWGLTNVYGSSQEDPKSPMQDTNSPVLWPLFFSVILAGLLRDIIDLGWWFMAYTKKYKGHYEEFRKWREEAAKVAAAAAAKAEKLAAKEAAKAEKAAAKEAAKAEKAAAKEAEKAAKEAEKVQSPSSTTLQRPPGLHALWRPQAFCSYLLLWDIFQLLLKAIFIWKISSFRGGAMSDGEQSLLTAFTLIQFCKVIYMFRLIECGKKVTTILSAFFSGAISEMLIVTGFFFLSICIGCAMLKRDNAKGGWITLYLYRGLLFGDGDALDYMGLDPKEQTHSYGGRTWLMLLATMIFNIVILNVIIAVYGSEYDRLESEAELHFQRERAKYCCELLLSMQKLHLNGDNGVDEAWKLSLLKVTTVLALLFGFAIHTGFYLLKVGEVPEEGGCSWTVLLLSILSAILFAYAQEGIQAAWMTSCWFPMREGEKEGPEKPHFLWICYQTSFSEDKFTSDELNCETVRDTVQKIVDERVGKLEDRLQGKLDILEQRLEKIDGKSLEQKLEKMESILERVQKMMEFQSTQTPILQRQ